MTERSGPAGRNARKRHVNLLGKTSQISIDIIIFVFAFIASDQRQVLFPSPLPHSEMLPRNK